MKTNMPLISIGQMKRIVNSSKKCILMIVKPKESDSNSAFDGCYPLHKNDLIKVVYDFYEIFYFLREKFNMRFNCYKMLHCLTLVCTGYPSLKMKKMKNKYTN